MSLFDDLLKKKKTESVVLIDVGADSVAGAYVSYTEGEQPVLLYARRLPIEIHKDEPNETAMLRALGVLGDALIREGAPVLMRATGSGHNDQVLVSVDAPWQTTSVRTEYLEQKDPFIFTKWLVNEALKRTSTAPTGQFLADESIIGTILNGYETREPFGKEARRASIVVLTSLIDAHVAESIHTSVRSLYHTKNILSIAGNSLRYQAMRITFPYERDALILDATGPLTTIALVRRDLLIDVVEILNPAADSSAWLKKISGEFTKLAELFPLPRTIFLLARESEASPLREALDTANLGSLWLSENPPKIVSVLASHLAGSIRQETTTTPDLPLLLMALYWSRRAHEE